MHPATCHEGACPIGISSCRLPQALCRACMTFISGWACGNEKHSSAGMGDSGLWAIRSSSSRIGSAMAWAGMRRGTIPGAPSGHLLLEKVPGCLTASPQPPAPSPRFNPRRSWWGHQGFIIGNFIGPNGAWVAGPPWPQFIHVRFWLAASVAAALAAAVAASSHTVVPVAAGPMMAVVTPAP